MSEIKWEEPPLSHGQSAGRSRWIEVAAALRARPNEWALISREGGESATTATDIRTGRLRAWQPKGAFEATTRKRPTVSGQPLRFDIYARFIGEPS